MLLVRAAIAQEPAPIVAPFPSLLVATFSVALHVRSLALAAGALVAAVAGMTGALLLEFYGTRPDIGSMLVLIFFVAGAWGAGRLLYRRDAQLRASERYSVEQAQQAVANERLRIARELHDVVAHSLSIIAVNAGAARELSELDPRSAREHMDAVADTAREALVEMRHVLEALREDGENGLAPQPTLDQLPGLVAQVRAAGLPVRLVERGDRRMLPPGVELAAYRVAQEALTNVRRHAGAVDTEVRVSYGERVLDLEVRNAPGAGETARPPGHGLLGMRERARLYGGALHAGPAEDGGYSVRLTLPVEPS